MGCHVCRQPTYTAVQSETFLNRHLLIWPPRFPAVFLTKWNVNTNFYSMLVRHLQSGSGSTFQNKWSRCVYVDFLYLAASAVYIPRMHIKHRWDVDCTCNALEYSTECACVILVMTIPISPPPPPPPHTHIHMIFTTYLRYYVDQGVVKYRYFTTP